ncbi:protein NEGATIVE GRAVITROPIC RESPONSE OF ROOTS-like [Bidens hawaiensis]|uniref:protein NEGATIVE GRAVITROPIC RESPONSE OF ROOTS-like n=1 Tax=Bidens hawaiensis TaxID=980011 RepID=UPI00404B8F16
MQFFGWVQNKFNGVQRHKNSGTATSSTHPHKEEFNDWPRGFLAIGTFGNNDHLPTETIEEIECAENSINGTATSSPDLSEFTPEEIGKLQKKLTKLLSKKPKQGDQTSTTTTDLPLDRFLNCPSSLEVDRRLSTTTFITNPEDKEEIDRTIKVILGRCKDICKENNSKKAIGKKSVSFLLKKMFVCSSGLPPMPGLHDRLPESRMERLLRAILKNKINPQNSFRASSAKKLTDNRQSAKKGKARAAEKDDEDANDGSKWVKTDSEYIVLEI